MNKLKKLVFGVIAFMVSSAQGLASGTGGMVWEKPATSIAKSISGPMAGIIALVAIIAAALAWSMTDGGNMMGKAIKIVIAFAIVGGAATFLALFGLNTGGGMIL